MLGPGTVVWESDDRLRVDGTGYVLMDVDPSVDELQIYKPRLLLEGYEPIIEEFQGANIMELGIYGGGSTAYLAQRCAPRRLVALDRSPDRVAALDRFVEAHDLSDRISLHLGVDQSDQDALRSIVAHDFGGEGIDLVIDDASHLYEPTLASFEVLFPHVRPGGLYVIEDWASDSWLIRSFVGSIGSPEPMTHALMKTWVADAIRAENVVGRVFERWADRALRDPGDPDHDAVTRWCRDLDRDDAGDDARVIIERLRACREQDLDGSAPTLGTLGMQLVLAVMGLCSSIASVAVTPFTIVVRRGGPFLSEPFTVGSVATDRVGVLGTLAPGPPHADAGPPR